MSSKGLSLALCLGVLPLCGCSDQLTKGKATAVIEAALTQRKSAGMPVLTEGSIDVQVGDIRGASLGNDCRDQPLEMADLQRYDRAKVIHLDRPEPCKWVVTLSPQALRDVSYDATLKPPSLRDYNTVSIALSQWQSFDVTKIEQSGVSADVDVTFTYRFTETMRQLARAGVSPEFKAGCTADTRNAQVQCTRTLPMTFDGGAWRLDSTKLG